MKFDLSAMFTFSGDISAIKKDVENFVNYDFILINDSIAEHKVRISTNLPTYWFPYKELTLKPKQTIELSS